MIRTSHGSKRKRSVLKQTKLQSTQRSSESNNSQSSKTSTKNSTDRYPNTSFPELPVGEGKIKQLPDGTISYDCEHYTQTWSLLRSTKRAEFFCEMASQLGVSPQEFRDILSRVDKRLARRRAHRRKKMRAAEEKKERQRKKKEAAEKRKLQKQQSQRSKKKQKKTKDGQKKSASAKNKASTGKTKGKAASMPVIPAQDKDTLIVERWFYDPPSSQGIQEIESLPRPPAPTDKSLHMSPATIIEALQDCYGPGHTEICTCGYSCYHIAVPPKTTQYVSERYLTHFCNPFGRGQFDLYRYSIKRLEKNHSAVYNHILKLCDLFFSLGFLEDDTWGRERVFAGYSRLLTFELIENVEYGKSSFL
eukprot:g2192.t1